LPKYKREFCINFSMRNPFDRSGFPYGSRKRITPEGEPLEGSGVSRSFVRIVIPIIICIIIVSVIAISSVRIVDAGYRGVLVQFGNVDTSKSLDEGLHFVIPFRDNVVFSNLGIKTMQVWTIEDNRIYTITYVAEEEDFEEDFQVAKRMIQSFEIKE
jgi:hypothetical protein